MEKEYKKGTVCYRCGASKEEAKKYGGGCSAWGKSWERHFFNTKPLLVSETIIKTP